jgi:hypothetical protein
MSDWGRYIRILYYTSRKQESKLEYGWAWEVHTECIYNICTVFKALYCYECLQILH